ncbi:MAG: TetR/AcrR family transcriptional regulator [Pseudoclavibacter sp.]
MAIESAVNTADASGASSDGRPDAGGATGAERARAPRVRRSPAERRAQIALAAEAIAKEDGLDAVTLRAVATRAGMTPALVAHHSESMDALVATTFTAVVSVELGDMRELARSYARGGPSGGGAAGAASVAEADGTGHGRVGGASAAAALVAVLDGSIDVSRADVDLVWVHGWALGARNPLLAEAVRRQSDEWRSFIASLIEQGIAVGEFACSDPHGVAAQVLSMIDGLNAHLLVSWQASEQRLFLLVRSVEALVETAPGTLTRLLPGSTA